MAIINGTGGNDTLNGTNENDIISGLNGDDRLYGLAGDDSLSGGAGNDYLEDTDGVNTLNGGAGNDTYFFGGDTATSIIDSAGIDTILADSSNVSIENWQTIENIDASNVEIDGLTFTGNSLNNIIYGTTGANTLTGGLGNDTYILQQNDDIIVEDDSSVKNSGIDTIKLTGMMNSLEMNQQKYDNVENLDASAITGTDLGLKGNALNNIITGSEGNDSINGNGGVDTMTGGKGNDTYTIDNLLDKVTEAANTKTVTDTGVDTIEFDVALETGTAKTYTLAANVENLDMDALELSAGQKEAFETTKLTITANALDNEITASFDSTDSMKILMGAGNDTFYGSNNTDTMTGSTGHDNANGGVGNDIMYGYAGNDTLFGDAGNDTIYGGNNNDRLDGGAGNDTIYGGTGANSIYGGTGNDFLDNSEATGTSLMDGGSGDDTYVATGSLTSIIDSAGVDTLISDGYIGLNAYSTIEILDASAIVNNNLYLSGNALNNTIYGATGTNNTYLGGLGNDTYVIKSVGDKITEDDATVKNSGIDTIKIVGANITDVNLTVAKYLNAENIDATGATAASITLTGNSSANTLTGSNIQGNSATLDGGVDSVIDTLKGGVENTNFVIHDLKDKITDAGGTDTIALADDFDNNITDSDTVSYTLNNTSIEILDASEVTTTNLTLKGNATRSTEIIGGKGDDNISGGTAVDSLSGGEGSGTIYGGNDTLYGGNDRLEDTLNGGDLDDTYLLQDLNDLIIEESGNDTIKLMAKFDNDTNARNAVEYTVTNTNIETIDASLMTKSITINGSDDTRTAYTLKGGSGADTINGGDADEIIYGGKGNDTINGGGGTNEIYGEDGNDTFLTDGSVTNVIDGGAGIDTMKLIGNDIDGTFTTAGFTLENTTNVENIDASGITLSSLNLVGNDLKNKITATINNDTIDGGTGADTMIGGRGNDVYTVDDSLDVVTELSNTKNIEDSGLDTVKFAQDFVFGKAKAYTLSANVENLDLSQLNLNTEQQTTFETIDLVINGNALGNEIMASENSADYIKIMAGGGNDTVIGGSGNDYADGGVGDDSLYGNEGNDTLFGGAGNDTIEGASGDDSLYGGDGNDTITDETGINYIDGGAGNDVINGGDGDDSILGGAGNDMLYGGAGTNDLQGGLGDDTYLYGDNESSTITEAKNAGSDTLKLMADENTGAYIGGVDEFILDAETFANVENIDASSITAVFDENNSGLTLTGNALDNKITGTDLNDTIDGGAGKNTLLGGAGNDTYIIDGSASSTTITDSSGTADTIKLVAQNQETNAFIATAYSIATQGSVENLDASEITSNITLTGNALNNTLTGGAGSNTLVGGLGDDTYIINAPTDKITEATNAGNDTVKLNGEIEITSVDLTPYANVENIDASLSTTAVALTGNTLANVLIGGESDDTINAGAGDDTLRGGAGVNSLYGEAGNDTFLVDGTETMIDAVMDGGDGIDTIKAVADDDGYINAQGTYTASIKDALTIENIDGSGVTVTELTLEGNAAANVITGGAANDTLDGGIGAGVDTLIGGLGDDIYIINKSSDVFTETINAGNDTIQIKADSEVTSVSLGNYSNIENIDGSAITSVETSLTLTGNIGANMITGGDGNDTIDGGGSGSVQLDTQSYYNSDDILLWTQNYTYDFDGNMLTRDYIEYAGDGVTVNSHTLSTYTYDSDGNQTSDESIRYEGEGYDIISEHTKEVYTYNEQGKTLTGIEISYDSEGNITDESNYTYDPVTENQIYYSSTGYNIDGETITVSWTEVDTYNSNGDTLTYEYKEFDTDGTITYWEKENDTYDANGNHLTYDYRELDANGVVTSRNTENYTFDAKNNQTSYTYKTYSDGVLTTNNSTTNAYTYDVEGNMLTNTCISYTDNVMESKTTDTYTYDGDGNKTSEEHKEYDANNAINERSSYEYAYVDGKMDTSNFTLYQADGITVDFYSETEYGYDIYGNQNFSESIRYNNKEKEIAQSRTTDTKTFDAQGHQLTVDHVQYRADNALSSTTYHEYDTSGNLLLQDTTNYQPDGVTISNHTTYTFTFNENSVQTSYDCIQRGANDIFGSHYAYIYTYDSQGAPLTTEYIIYNADGSVASSTGDSYEYDYSAPTDTLFGGLGNDVFKVDDATDIIDDSQGTNTIKLDSTFKTGTLDLNASNFTDAVIGTIDGSEVTDSSVELTLIGTDSDETIIGGDGNDTIQGGAGVDSLYGGLGNDMFLLDGRETMTEDFVIDGGEGIDTIKAVADGEGKYNGEDIYNASIADADTIENLDCSGITSTTSEITMTGNSLNNALIGGAGNDTLIGGIGNDTLTGGEGDNVYSFSEGSEIDLITSTGSGDTIQIDDSTGITIDDVLFYTDADGNFYIDYTDDTMVGSDIVKITATEYSNDTTIAVGTTTTTIGDVIALLGDYTELSGIEIAALSGTDKTAQAIAISSAWTILIDPSGDNTYLISDTQATTIDEAEGAGVDTLKLVPQGDGSFAGSTGLFPAASAVYIDNLSTTPNTIENLDASAVTTTDLTLKGNELDNVIVGGAGDNYIYGDTGDSITGGLGNDTMYGGLGTNFLNGGIDDDVYLVSGLENGTTIMDSQGNDSVVLFNAESQDRTGVFAGGDSYSISALQGTYDSVENLDASFITSDITLTGNDLDNIISGGSGNDTIFGGAGTNILNGGLGDDTYLIDGSETATTISDDGDFDTLRLIQDGDGKFHGEDAYSISLAGYADIETIEANNITATTLTLEGNDLDNAIYGGETLSNTISGGLGNDDLRGGHSADEISGGDGDDYLFGWQGDDTLTGGLGADTFAFWESDGNDQITATDATDTIDFDISSGLTKSDMLFYKDDVGNFYIDYTDDTVGADTVKIATANLDNGTTIKVGNDTISVNAITQYLAGSGSAYSGLDADGISALTTDDELTQAGALVWTPV